MNQFSTSSTLNSKILDKIKDCIIDQDGVFKYIQVNIKDISTAETKCVVRGYLIHEYHSDNFDDLKGMYYIRL